MDSFPKTYNDPFKKFDFSPHVRESLTVLDSGFHAVDSSQFQCCIPDSEQIILSDLLLVLDNNASTDFSSKMFRE